MATSRYRRRDVAGERVVVTARDLGILGLVHAHRFMLAEHLHPLAFPGRTLRTCQQRLAKLWQHRYLDRLFLPSAPDGTGRAEAATPAYALAARGAEALRGSSAEPDGVGGAPRDRGASPSTLAHHLAVTDVLASLEAAALAAGEPESVATEHEWSLWRRASRSPGGTDGLSVPDGAATFRGGPAEGTWYVEVVRAGVSGGNGTFLAKMRRYLALRAEGRLQAAFGHARLRGVLVAAPTAARAEALRSLAARLPNGRRLFAFAHFEERRGDRRVRRFRPGTVLGIPWTDGAGGAFTLGNPDVRDAPAPDPHAR